MALALPTKIKQVCKGLPQKNTLTYLAILGFTKKKCFTYGLRPYIQTFNKAIKTYQGQTLLLIWSFYKLLRKKNL
jgi:hypothetical protein